MENNIEIGKRIEIRRKEMGYTQEQVANAVGVVKSTIQRYEKGTIKELKMPVLQAIAKALQVNPDWLVLKTDKKDCSCDKQKNTLIDNYNNLNDIGKKKLVDYSSDLLSSYKYETIIATKSNSSLKIPAAARNGGLSELPDSDLIDTDVNNASDPDFL